MPESVITKDIYGNPIDFNKDGYADLLETGKADTFIGYGTQTRDVEHREPRERSARWPSAAPMARSFRTKVSKQSAA